MLSRERGTKVLRLIKEKMLENIAENINKYIIMIGLLIIGCIVGVVIINSSNDDKRANITEYINSYKNTLTNNKENINYNESIKNEIRNGVIETVILWISGMLIFSNIVAYIFIFFRGMCLGYTIASAVGTFGAWKGSIYSVSGTLLHNIIIIPVIIYLAVLTINMSKQIYIDKKKDNIRFEITRYTIKYIISFFILILAFVIKIYISLNLLIRCLPLITN